MGKHRFANKKMRGPGRGMKDDRETNEKGVRKNYSEIIKENEAFEKYYKMQNICPEGEWEQMMAACRESLPTAFRITASRSEGNTMLHILENHLIRDVIASGKNENHQVEIKPIPWYPNKMAWQCNLTRKDIRSNESYLRFHNFLIAETESGYTSRQEAVSMIPPLALKVEPHHKVLDMCASPGSKTAQIIEMLHADESKPPEGYVIANDLDNKRCYMLVHQGKRLQSPAFVVTNHDASRFPDVTISDADGKKKYLKFDRVLCDVPCSGDGTIRKNIDVWRKWSPANALCLHQIQYQILKRGLELLEVGGLLVYSTCSLNPVEDEAVVLRMLQDAKGSVELLDIDLPHLKHMKGLSHWKVCSRDLQAYDKMEDVPEKWVTTIRPYTFPPSEEDAQKYHLDKCVRVLPHQQDTGGFFIALLSKTKDLPWEEAKEPPQDTANVTDTESTPPVEEETKSKYISYPPKRPRRMMGFKEDPFVFMKDDNEILPKLKNFFGLDDALNSTNFVRRSVQGKIRNIYLTTDTVRNFVNNNKNSLKIINAGVKAFARIDNKWSTCEFRLSQDGLSSLSPHVKSRRIHVSKEDLICMLEQSEAEKAPLLSEFTEKTQAQIAAVEGGSVILVTEFTMDEDKDIKGPHCSFELVGWKGAVSLRAYIQKNDRMHYLRLCGVNVSKYEANKFENKDEEVKLEKEEVDIDGQEMETDSVIADIDPKNSVESSV